MNSTLPQPQTSTPTSPINCQTAASVAVKHPKMLQTETKTLHKEPIVPSQSSRPSGQDSKIRLPSISSLAHSLPPPTREYIPAPLLEKTLSASNSVLRSSLEESIRHRTNEAKPSTSTPSFSGVQTPYQPPLGYSPYPQYHAPVIINGDIHQKLPQKLTPSPQLQAPPVPQHQTQLYHYGPQFSQPPIHIPVHPYPQPTPHQTTYQAPQYVVKPRTRRSKRDTGRKNNSRLYCQRCGITETPEWRKGPNGARTLCNACGLYHAKILLREGPEAALAAIQRKGTTAKGGSLNRRSLGNVENTQGTPLYGAKSQYIPMAYAPLQQTLAQYPEHSQQQTSGQPFPVPSLKFSTAASPHDNLFPTLTNIRPLNDPRWVQSPFFSDGSRR